MKTTHFRISSASQKRACLSSLFNLIYPWKNWVLRKNLLGRAFFGNSIYKEDWLFYPLPLAMKLLPVLPRTRQEIYVNPCDIDIVKASE